MGDPITPVILAVNIGCGLATNLSQAGGATAYRRVADLLSRGKPRENHDILKATHAAFVGTMETMARAARRASAGGPAEDIAAARALDRLCSEPAFRDFRYDGEQFPLAAVNEAIDRMFAGGLAKADGSGRTDPDLALNRLIVADLAAWGVPLTPALEELFVHGNSEDSPWHLVFRTAFADQVKHNGTAFRILTFERLGELRSIGLTLISEVDQIHDRLDRIEAMLMEVLRRLPEAVPAGLTLALLGVIVLTVQFQAPPALRLPTASPDRPSGEVAGVHPGQGLDSSADGGGNAAGATDAAPWPKGARIVEEGGVTYQVDSDEKRAPMGSQDWRIAREDGATYRVDPDGTRVRIGPDPGLPLDSDLPDAVTRPPGRAEVASFDLLVRGLWGDRGCNETYRIGIDRQTRLIVEPQTGGTSARFAREWEIVDLSDGTARLITDPRVGRRSEMSTISYSRQGGREQLIWTDGLEAGRVLFRRCG